MPITTSIVYFAWFLVATLLAATTSLTPADKLQLPTHVDDAVFADTDEIIVLSSETSNPSNGERRCFLSAWDIHQKKWLLTEPLDAIPPSVSCGGLRNSSFLHRLLVTANSELLVVNPQTLRPEREISVKPNQIAATAEQEGIVYAVSEPGIKPVTLSSYDLGRGALIQQRELLGFDYGPGTLLRVAAISNRQLAILQSDAEPLGVHEKNSTLAICAQREPVTCKTVALPMAVGNFIVYGDSLLFVSDGMADRSPQSLNQCIAKLSLTTLQVDPHAYCRPDAGVHYSVAAIGGDFVLGYSGYGTKRGWLDDGLVVSKSGSISVWDATSGRLTATATLPHGKSFTLTSSDIRADTSGKERFLFFNPAEGHEILLYDLSSLGSRRGTGN